MHLSCQLSWLIVTAYSHYLGKICSKHTPLFFHSRMNETNTNFFSGAGVLAHCCSFMSQNLNTYMHLIRYNNACIKSRTSFGQDHIAQFPLYDFCHGALATFGPWVEIARRYVQHTKRDLNRSMLTFPIACAAHVSKQSQPNWNTFICSRGAHIISYIHSGINNSICAPRVGESKESQPTHSAYSNRTRTLSYKKCNNNCCLEMLREVVNSNLPPRTLYGRNFIRLATLSARIRRKTYDERS